MTRKRKNKVSDTTTSLSKERKSETFNLNTDFDCSKKVDDLYGVKFPNDFYHLWNLCQKLEPKSPLDAFSIINFKLVGPFYFMYNQKECDPSLPAVNYHMKWRYYYDTPEFLTLIASKDSSYHLGYFRDNPKENTCIVTDNTGNDPVMSVLGDNLFAALRTCLRNSLNDLNGDDLKRLKFVLEYVQEYAKKENFDLAVMSKLVRERKKKVVSRSFHKAGIVVPIIDDTGYRCLHYDNLKLKQIFKKVVNAKDDDERLVAFERIQELVTYIQLANDECDFGMGLELGLDLFCDGSKYFFKTSEMLLSTAYQLLNMEFYKEIIKAHFADRRTENFARIDSV